MRGTNQGGSLAGFIAVGVLLALVLIGGLYGLNRYNAERANEETASEPVADEATNDDRQRTDDESTEEATDREVTPTVGDPGDATDETPAEDSESDAATTANLPETGPADTALLFVGLGAVTFAGTHYLRSRSQR